MRLIIILFLITLSVFSFGQNVGFRGKKFSVEFNTNTIVSISNALMYNSFKNGRFNSYPNSAEIRKFRKKFKGLKLKLHPELTLNYTIARRMSIGAKIGYDRLNYFPIQGINVINELPTYTPELEELEETSEYDLGLDTKPFFHSNLEITKVNVIETLFYVRIYGKNQIAPVGYYHQFGIGRSHFSVKNNKIDGFIGLIGEENYRVEEGSLDYTMEVASNNVYYFSYGLGNKKVFSNGMYFQYGFEINVYFGSKFSEKKMSKQEGFTKGSYNYHYKNARRISKTIAIDHFMQNKLGIGYIF